MTETTANKIKIKLTAEQRQQIYQATGFGPFKIEFTPFELGILTLAAVAVGSEALPLTTSVAKTQMALRRTGIHVQGDDQFTLEVDLTNKQKDQIKEITGKSMSSLLVTPDEWKLDYREQWETDTAALHVGHSIVIVPLGDVYESTPKERVITLPGCKGAEEKIFGTGQHPTTQLPLEILEDALKGGERVLDLGTGSGILAVAACRLGASHVLALDIEASAVAMALETVAANGLGKSVEVKLGGIDVVTDQYDLVVANIFTGVIISLAGALANAVRQGGQLITSGIIAARSSDVVKAICAVGFEVEEQREQNGWRALLFRRA